ncbi:diguanylate cyclase [Acuticoccus sp. MNP-M23]|uniref:GGDEF domain-containing protein n=1 Tax=Acuticoccus sp. MNP-M23 TaxID=3072793 RepID=UPI002814EBFB|nr:diguanylate cyclase [Acuticoccus sp. MNP-M23]WMS43430.1 diguanylate cyclase [Acuticoccus sp. MNP-M23]
MLSLYLIPLLDFAGLMALSALFFVFVRRSVSARLTRQIVFGLILGMGVVAASLQPIMVVSGVQIDPRNLFVGCAGAFGGPLAALVGFAIAAATRFAEETGHAHVCVLSLLLATVAGLVWRHLSRGVPDIKGKHFLALGLAISVSYVCTFLLPRESWWPILTTALPFLVSINIVGAMLVGGILERDQRRNQRERHLSHQASVDPLTGLMNRRAFETLYATLTRNPVSSGTACILIDLDHFKKVNDTFGHAVGDRVLVSVSRRLRATIRDADIAARFGGEEFAVCLPGADKTQTAIVVKRIREAIAAVGTTELEFGVPVTASVGICWSEVPMALDAALEVADRALYRAKMSGRDRMLFGNSGDGAGKTSAGISRPAARPAQREPLAG